MDINIYALKEFGWNQYFLADCTVWFKGYLINANIDEIFRCGQDLLNKKYSNVEVFSKWIKSFRGHFSIIIYSSDRLFCAVDHVRSIPLFYNYDAKQITVATNAVELLEKPELNLELDNAEAALEMAMSGYTIGKKTLGTGISQLEAGKCILVNKNKLTFHRYYRYCPWNSVSKNKNELKAELTKLLKDMFERVAESCKGRQIVIPLSGGHDSRLIASGLKEVGFQDVVCFSYGLSNNFEAKAAKKIAERLGYKYVFIPLSLKIQRDLFSQRGFNDFWKMTNTLCNSPVLIDYSAVKILIKNNHIARNAIFINGNSGDFISGGHIVPHHKKLDLDDFVDTIIKKHYSLWASLLSQKNTKKIKSSLLVRITKIMCDFGLTEDELSAIGESIEWSGRQSKFVTTTQRSYEFHGHEWRLPLWDPIFMDFWEKTPQSFKVKQSLYKEVLYENNWGNVWDNIQVNNFQLASYKLRIIRNITKLFFVFAGRASWKKFDKRVFNYFYDNTAATVIEPYRNVVLDRHGARDRNSWISRKYLAHKEIRLLD